LGFNPDESQAMILEAAACSPRIALNCNRQWGKSTIAAILAVHRLYMEAGTTVLIVAPSGRQSGETLRKVGMFLSVLGVSTCGDGVNERSLVLPNGSRVVSLPPVADTVRGFSDVSLVILDEAARVSDDVYLAIRPSMAVAKGDIVLVSTPRGRRGFFYREMTEVERADGEKWLRFTGPVTGCLRVPEEFLATERARGDAYYRQEYLCEFLETGIYLFDEALVNHMVKAFLEAWACPL
jgi:hypothetical protein